MTKIATITKAAAPKKKPRYSQKDQGEDIAIIETKTDKVVVLVPYRPNFGAANRELYRDRQSEAEANKVAELVTKALNQT